MKIFKSLVLTVFLTGTSFGAVDCLSVSLNTNKKVLVELSSRLTFLQNQSASEVKSCIEDQATMVTANCYFKDAKVVSLFRALVVPNDKCLEQYSQRGATFNKLEKYADEVARFSNYLKPLALVTGGLTLSPKKSFLPEAKSLLNKTNKLIQVSNSFRE